MYYHNHIADFEALTKTPDTAAVNHPIDNVLAIIASLVFVLMAIAIVFN